MDEFAIIPVREAVFCPTRSPSVVVDVISGGNSADNGRVRSGNAAGNKKTPGTSAAADIAGVFYKGIGKIFSSTTRCKIRHKDGPVAIAGICDQRTDDLQSEPEITPESHFVEQLVRDDPVIVAVCVASRLTGL
ncbi:hypothetical protein pipiens_012995 [Culex pipiens pipiens]|uniref:Uncharacterized protein n=1 Tax=Culex pipiens pipiens TaxID=38569 RepID=A0ABD1D037_CULPP